MTDEIMAMAAGRRLNSLLVADCSRLGYLVEPVVDVTYNAGRFWEFVPAPELKFDLDPQWGVPVADFTNLPLKDCSVNTVVLDPPYKLNGTSTGVGPSALDAGYDVGGEYRSVKQKHDLIKAGIDEAARVLKPKGLLLLKCQAQQSCGSMHDQPAIFSQYALSTGWWTDVDRLHVPTKSRKQPRAQRTARSNFSTLVVLRRRTRRKGI